MPGVLGIGFTLFLSAAVAGSPSGEAPGTTQRPNIVVILSDDAGYSDLGCYGSEIATPHIDALAEGGLRFRTFYNNSRCSPSRASLLTGQYPHTVGVGDLCRPREETPFPGYLGYMSEDAVTVAEILGAAGYRTVLSGKWHLGGERVLEDGAPAPGEMEKWPLARGFERFFGIIHGATSYFEPWDFRPFRLGEARYEPEEDFYATDAVTDYAIESLREIRAEGDEPFFLYLSHLAPHKPYEAPESVVEKYRKLYRTDWNRLHRQRIAYLQESGLIPAEWEPAPLPPFLAEGTPAPSIIEEMAHHAAMIEILDRNVGRFVEELERMGERGRTLIFVLSDNGARGKQHALGVTPFRGRKGSLLQGGIATHCVVSWPNGIVEPGRIVTETPHLIDMLPTFLDVADIPLPDRLNGRPVPPPSGLSFLPLLQGKPWQGNESLFWDLYGMQVVIEGRWKYISDVRNRQHLYDLSTDGTEMHDLAEQYPERVEAMARAHAAWAEANQVLPYDTVLEAQGRPEKAERIRRIRE